MKRFVLHATVGAMCVVSGLASSAGGQVPEGFEVVTLANDLGFHSRASVNERSEVVWSSSFPPDVSTVFMFSDGIIRRIIDEDWYDINPAINTEGMMAWMRGPDWNPPFDVMTYKDGIISAIPDAPPTFEPPAINASGHVVGSDASTGNPRQMELFFYDGDTVQQITHNGLSNQLPTMNDVDQIVWIRIDFEASPRTEVIMLYSDGNITQVTDETDTSVSPHLNDLGVVTWRHRDGNESEVRTWEGGVTTTVFEDGAAPKINNNGDITFMRWHEGDQHWDIWLYKNDKFHSLPDAGFGAWGPRINDRGEVCWNIWQNDFGDTGVFFMRRIAPKADSDHDCHVDFADFQAFQLCFTGADAGPPGGLLGDCTRSDLDGDGDVDNGDFEAFLGAVTGPGERVPGCEP